MLRVRKRVCLILVLGIAAAIMAPGGSFGQPPDGQTAIACPGGECDSDGDGIPDELPAELVYGAPDAGSIEMVTGVDFLGFWGVAGSRIRLQVQGTGPLDVRLEVWDPDGDQLEDDFCSESCSLVKETADFALLPSDTVPKTGRYLVAISDAGGDDAGDYEIRIDCLSGDCVDEHPPPPQGGDNCIEHTNRDQRDTNNDGYGNACDADLNDDQIVDFVDLGLLKAAFFTADPDADLNGDGIVDFLDFGRMKALFFEAPGPSGFPRPTDFTVVRSLADVEYPASGQVTLRSALANTEDGQTIRFSPRLDGDTIELSIVGEENSVLKGEVMGIREEETGPVSYLVGYFERNYGRSALYARKNVVIDASSLPSGITLAWVGGEENPARVLAVYGSLTLKNVSITGGWSVAEGLPPDEDDEYAQLSTRARGGGVAVWGTVQLEDCTIYDNHCKRDAAVPARSRDAGVFGGGVYADIVEMTGCVVSGNSVSASGVSGGGVFSVGGADASPKEDSSIDQSAITGNRIQGIFAYGGGIYSDGGGIGKLKTLALTNSTVARNVVEPLPGLPSFMYGIGYWRGGGLYMSNGYLQLHGVTIVENQVYGKPRTDSLDRPNLAGGVAATIGNAHAVEEMNIGHSVIAGNTVHEVDPAAGGGAPGTVYDHDLFTGSLLHFKSRGYNRFGVIDLSQILVPVGEPRWSSFARRHFPKVGDEDGVALADVLDLAGGVTRSDTVLSVGVDAGELAVLGYQPRGSAVDQIPAQPYWVEDVYAEYNIRRAVHNDFLAILLDRLEGYYGLDAGFSAAFTADFEAFLGSVDVDEDTEGVQPYTDPLGNPILTLEDTLWFGPAVTWPRVLANHPYIHFWHRLDRALLDAGIPELGAEVLGDADWAALFPSGPLGEGEDPEIVMTVDTVAGAGFPMLPVDQSGTERPPSQPGDIGAIEAQAQPPSASP